MLLSLSPIFLSRFLPEINSKPTDHFLPGEPFTRCFSARTSLAFSYLQEISSGKSSLASQSIPSWNQIIAWLKEMEALRTIAA
jgi:hypothetical protein